MTDQAAMNRMRELMLSVDSLERFHSIRARLPGVVMISLLSILASAVIYAAVNVTDYLTVNWFVGNIQIGNSYIGSGIFAFFAWAGGIVAVYVTLTRAYRSPVPIDWENDLKEGPLGIVKIMSRYDWEKILVDLRGAKQGFVLVAALQLLLNFILIFFLAFFGIGFLLALILQVTPNIYYIALFSALATMALGDRSMKRLYERLWSADILIGELRRFYIDFSEREL